MMDTEIKTPEINWEASPGFVVVRDREHLEQLLDAACSSPRKYRLCDWEENGYHDSYGYVAYWNEETQAVESEEYWATAYAGGKSLDSFTAPPTLEAVEKACAWLARHIFRLIRESEHKNVFAPDAVERGDELIVVRDCRHKGSPTTPAGTQGRVFWSQAYGQFYRNGYNRPSNKNTRVGLELASGERVFVPLSACRRAAEPMSDADLMARADRLSLDCQFGRALSSKFAWDSNNWAAAIIEPKRAAIDSAERLASWEIQVVA